MWILFKCAFIFPKLCACTGSIKICPVRNLEVDGCPSKENLFGQSALLMNATYVFP